MTADSVSSPIIVTFRRIVRQPITLSDGFQLHPGQQIAIAAKCINSDRDLIPDADVFKPLRWTEQDGTVPTTFSNSSASNLNFGLGRYACPGRFMAAVRDFSSSLRVVASRRLRSVSPLLASCKLDHIQLTWKHLVTCSI